jgi:hypothetical protein
MLTKKLTLAAVVAGLIEARRSCFTIDAEVKISLGQVILVVDVLRRNHVPELFLAGHQEEWPNGVVAQIGMKSCGGGEVVNFSCDEKEDHLPPPQLERL